MASSGAGSDINKKLLLTSVDINGWFFLVKSFIYSSLCLAVSWLPAHVGAQFVSTCSSPTLSARLSNDNGKCYRCNADVMHKRVSLAPCMEQLYKKHYTQLDGQAIHQHCCRTSAACCNNANHVTYYALLLICFSSEIPETTPPALKWNPIVSNH